SGTIVNNELTRIEQQLFDADWAEARGRLGDDATIADLARTPAQRRADALVEMATRSATAPADGRRPEPLFSVFVDYETFAGRICELANGAVVTPGSVVGWLPQSWIERVCSTGRLASSIWVSQSACSPVGCAGRCNSGTGSASTPTATCQPSTARSTTSFPLPPVARPPRTTAAPRADSTTEGVTDDRSHRLPDRERWRRHQASERQQWQVSMRRTRRASPSNVGLTPEPSGGVVDAKHPREAPASAERHIPSARPPKSDAEPAQVVMCAGASDGQALAGAVAANGVVRSVVADRGVATALEVGTDGVGLDLGVGLDPRCCPGVVVEGHRPRDVVAAQLCVGCVTGQGDAVAHGVAGTGWRAVVARVTDDHRTRGVGDRDRAADVAAADGDPCRPVGVDVAADGRVHQHQRTARRHGHVAGDAATGDTGRARQIATAAR